MLIGTSDVRTWLSIPDGEKAPNDKLNSLCSAIQSFVESYVGRPLEAQVFRTDPDNCYLDGTGRPFIYVPVYPISNIYEVAVDNDHVFGSGTVIGTNDIFFYPDGKIISEAGYFTRGRRNVRIDYLAGYGSAGSYPLPGDLKQVMVEMIVQSYKTGLTAISQIAQPQGNISTTKLLSDNTFWKETLDGYKKMGSIGFSYDEDRTHYGGFQHGY